MKLRKFGEANVAKPRLTDANGTSAKKQKTKKQKTRLTFDLPSKPRRPLPVTDEQITWPN